MAYNPTARDVVHFGRNTVTSQQAPIGVHSQPLHLVLHSIKLTGDSQCCAQTDTKAGYPSITHPDIVNSKIFARSAALLT